MSLLLIAQGDRCIDRVEGSRKALLCVVSQMYATLDEVKAICVRHESIRGCVVFRLPLGKDLSVIHANCFKNRQLDRLV